MTAISFDQSRMTAIEKQLELYRSKSPKERVRHLDRSMDSKSSDLLWGLKIAGAAFVAAFAVIFLGSVLGGLVAKYPDPLAFAIGNMQYAFKAVLTVLTYSLAQVLFVLAIAYDYLSNLFLLFATLVQGEQAAQAAAPLLKFAFIAVLVLGLASLYYLARRVIKPSSPLIWRGVQLFSVTLFVLFHLPELASLNQELGIYLVSEPLGLTLLAK